MKDNYEINLSVGDNSAEDMQRTVNGIIKWAGLLMSFVFGIIMGYFLKGYGKEFNFTAFLVVWIAGSAITILIWSTNMILINISDNLRTIKHLLAQNNSVVVSSKTDDVVTPATSIVESVNSTTKTLSGEAKEFSHNYNSNLSAARRTSPEAGIPSVLYFVIFIIFVVMLTLCIIHK